MVAYDQEGVDDFIQVADIIEENFPEVMVEGVEVSSPVEGRTFSITLEDGTPVVMPRTMEETPVPTERQLIDSLTKMGLTQVPQT